MKWLFIISNVFIFSFIMADEPPNYCNYEIFSQNKLYVAKIIGEKEDSQFKKITKFTIKVYSLKDDKLLWSTPFIHTGYPDAMISNDGKVVIDFLYFYGEDGIQVYIYNEKGLAKTIYAKDLKISKVYLKKTESHYLWIADSDCGIEFSEAINFVDGKDGSPTLSVIMRNGRALYVDLSTLSYYFKDSSKKISCQKPEDKSIESIK
ncbi:MAG TPA: hypothetical protein PLZ43_04265 [bacterium]|nr:hypothetical protein [bacterium]